MNTMDAVRRYVLNPLRRPAILLGLLLLLPAVRAAAQDVEVQSLPAVRSATTVLAVGDKVLVGTDVGGVLVMDRTGVAPMEHWVSGQRLSGNQISDIVWSGRSVWIATGDNGLTRVDDMDGTPRFRQFLDNLGSRNLTCVTGAMIDGSEVVWYGMSGAGIGKITDGIPGFLYSADQDGLIDDDVNDMQFLGPDLFVATPSGISRLRNNLFTDENAGLSSTWIYDLELDGNGDLIASSKAGIHRWDPDAETWSSIGQIGAWVLDIAVETDGTIWALGLNSSSEWILFGNSGSGWEAATLPEPDTAVLFADADLWAGGTTREAGWSGSTGRAFLSRALEAGAWETRISDYSLVRNSYGVAYSADGSAWIGSWLGRSISTLDPEGDWRHIATEAATIEEGDGLIAFGPNVVAMACDLDGMIWASQFSFNIGGVLRIDPETMGVDIVRPDNSGLGGGSLLNIITHPDGPLIFQHDLDGGMVDILLDPADWENPAQWIAVSQDAEALGSDAKVWEAVVQRRDVIWFAVEGVGLVRWDINGSSAGADDELTWADTSDDLWEPPVVQFLDRNDFVVSDPRAVRGLALAEDGSIWAGGNELVRFVYSLANHRATAVEVWDEKTVPYQEGMLSGSVNDLAFDANGDLWIATTAGVNRMRVRDGSTEFDPWLDLSNYLLYPSLRELYSPSVVAEMPGLEYYRLAVDPTGLEVLVSSDRGATRFLVEEGLGGGETTAAVPLEQLYLYPNPWDPAGSEGRLKLCSFVDDIGDEETASVEIYNLEGQIVFRDSQVTPLAEADEYDGFWTGLNRPGEPVTTGLYVVKIAWRGETTTRTLAVVR